LKLPIEKLIEGIIKVRENRKLMNFQELSLGFKKYETINKSKPFSYLILL